VVPNCHKRAPMGSLTCTSLLLLFHLIYTAHLPARLADKQYLKVLFANLLWEKNTFD
jgi:hypothetical protein